MKNYLVLLFGIGLSSICVAQAQEQDGYFAKLSKETVIEVISSNLDYSQIHVESNSGKHDTIWISGAITPPALSLKFNNDSVVSDSLYDISDETKRQKIIIDDAVYPVSALKKGEEGKIEVSCIIEIDGTLSHINLINSISEDIDHEVFRILSKTNFTPLKLMDSSFRCKHRLCFLFEIEEKDKKKTGKVFYIIPNRLCSGVSKRYRKKRWYTYERTSRYYDKLSGFLTFHEKIDYLLSMEIDIPKNNLHLESLLCNLLFEKEGKSIELVGNKFTKKFDDDIDMGNVVNGRSRGGGAYNIIAHAIGYAPNRFLSYGWHVSINDMYITDVNLKSSYNFIYDIQGTKVLTVSDVITPEVQMQIKNDMGIRDMNNIDLGLDDKFLYIGKIGEKIATIGLSKENWQKFAPPLQHLIGPFEKLPNSRNEKDYLFENLIGIQPELVKNKIVKKPSVNGVELIELVNNYINYSDGKVDNSQLSAADISFVVEKDGALSNVEIVGNPLMRDKILRIIQGYKWQPLLFSNNNSEKSFIACKFIPHDRNDANESEIYEFVDQMPQFVGGNAALVKWTMENLNYPLEAIEKNIEGRVFVSCVIEKDGSITNPRIQRSVDPSIDSEAIRMVKNLPNWNPGRKDGIPVRVKQTIPILFRLKYMQNDK